MYVFLFRLLLLLGGYDYYFNLDDFEGVCDLFDILNLDMFFLLIGVMVFI